MRKLFVIVLMLALVPFTTGCRIDGLWGFDDEEGTAVAVGPDKTANLTLALKPNIGAASIRALNSGSMQYSVVYSATDISTAVSPTSSDATATKVTLSLTLKKLSLAGGYYSVTVRIVDAVNGRNYDFTIQVPQAFADATDAVLTIDSLVINADGTITVTYTVTFTGLTTPYVGSATGTTYDSTGTAVTSVLIPTKVTYGTAETQMTTSAPTTGVDYTAPIFKVYFNQAVAAAPTSFEFVVTPTDSVKMSVITFTAAGGQLAIVPGTDNKSYHVTITGQSSIANKSLTPGTTYKVAIKGSVKSLDGLSTYAITTAETYTITTAKTALTSWDAQTAAGVTTKSGTSVAWSSTKKIVLTFDNPMADSAAALTKLQTAVETATVTVEGGNTTGGLATITSTLNYTDYFGLPTATNGGKSIVIPVGNTYYKSAGKSTVYNPAPLLAAASSVKITFKAGTFVDTLGHSIETPTTVTFTAN